MICTITMMLEFYVKFPKNDHCFKIVRIRSFSFPYFLAFGLRIQSECGKILTENL